MKTYTINSQEDLQQFKKDDVFKVEGNLILKCNIDIKESLVVEGFIQADGSINAGGSIQAGGYIKAGKSIQAEGCVEARKNIALSISENYSYLGKEDLKQISEYIKGLYNNYGE